MTLKVGANGIIGRRERNIREDVDRIDHVGSCLVITIPREGGKGHVGDVQMQMSSTTVTCIAHLTNDGRGSYALINSKVRQGLHVQISDIHGLICEGILLIHFQYCEVSSSTIAIRESV